MAPPRSATDRRADLPSAASQESAGADGGVRTSQSAVTPIHQRAIGHGQRRPDRIAVRHDGSGYSYGSLALRSRCAASLLAECGVRPGDRVAADGSIDVRFLEILLACGILGAVFVPIDRPGDSVSCRAVVAGSGATVLIRSDPTDEPGTARTLTAADVDRGITRSEPAPVPGMLPADQPALLCFPSGAMAAPDGALWTHGDLAATAEHVLAATGISARDTVLPTASLARIGVLSGVVIPALYVGARLVLPVSTEPAELAATAAGEAVTMMLAGPEGAPRPCRQKWFGAASPPSR